MNKSANTSRTTVASQSQATVDEKVAGIQLLIKAFFLFIFISNFGWIIGGICYFVGFRVLHLLIQLVLGLEGLTTMDYIFLFDKETGRANIVGVFIMKNFNFEKFKAQFVKKAYQFQRMKQRIRCYMGSYFWETIPDDEFEKIQDKLFVNLADEQISNEEELGSYMARELQIRDPLGLPQWRLLYKEKYQDDKSFFVIKLHHIMADGYGIITLISNLVDNWDERHLPDMKRYTVWQKFLLYIAVPFYFLKVTSAFILDKFDKNPFVNGRELSGIRNCTLAKEYSITEIKKKCKELQITVNDLLTTVISLTFKQYFISKGDEKTSDMMMMLPFNIREKPKNRTVFEFNNQFMIFPIRIALVNDFRTGFKIIHQNFSPLRSSFAAYGLYYLVMLVTSLPHQLAQFIINFLGAKPTIFVSNVQTTQIPYVIGGAQSVKIVSLIPGSGDVGGGFVFISHQDILQITFSADINRCENTKEIIKIFEKNLDEILTAKN